MQFHGQGRIITYRSQVGNPVGKRAEVETEHVFPDVDELLESCGAN